MRALAAAAAIALPALLVGCALDPSPPPSQSQRSLPSASTQTASPNPTEPLNGPSVPNPGIVSDPGLISSVLGTEQPGLTFLYDAETTDRTGADPALRRDASALAIGLYTVTGQSPVEDYAIVSVLRMRYPATANDDWFRSYRDSYDGSACAQAGGVARHAQSEIGSHTVFIGSCTGGAFTYHLRTKTGDLVVSVTAVGPGRLGEKLAAAVSDP